MANPIASGGPSPPTGDLVYDATTSGFQWTLGADRTIDWSISGGFAGETWASTEQLRLGLQAAFESISYFVDIRFNFLGVFSDPSAAARGGSEINVGLSREPRLVGDDNDFAAFGYFPTTQYDVGRYDGAHGDIVLNLNSAASTITDFLPGSGGFLLMLHELGHVLGLKHPHDDGGTGRPTLSDIGLEGLDFDWGTVMAYTDENDDPRFLPATPMMLDVVALRHLYGPNLSTNAGDDAHLVRATGRYSTIWDAGGHDAVDVSASIRGWYIYLPDDPVSALDPVQVGMATPLDELDLDAPQSLTWLMGDIEDVRGSAQGDEIYGSVLNNVIFGGGGDDYIDGWRGDDSLDGGAGDDVIYGDFGNDTIVDASGKNYLRGEDGDDRITGGVGFDDINGNMGNDTCVSGGGDDWVVGGRDNDSLVGSAGQNLVYGNLGNDTCDGGAGNDIVRGGQQNDVLTGGDGDDYVSGDKDSDTLTGGLGADTFHSFGDAGMDRVTDFNRAQGDRVLLDAGTTYTVAQSGADTVISMTGGAQMVLVGVQMSSLTDGWITVG
jgi:Ca2+-binding RTX toxin-like protein